MAEKTIFFPCGKIQLEGLLESKNSGRAVAVTHPHPLYGGDMHNHVVESMIRAYGKMGYTTLRFNFRGVGQSGGRHDHGTAEQSDVDAALRTLSDLGNQDLDLAGYSFGAWVNAKGYRSYENAQRLIMVSPPVHFMDFSFFRKCPKLRLVIAGARDDIGPPEMIRQMLPAWNPEAALKIIEDADHFYGGKTQKIEEIIQAFLESK